MSVLKVNTDDMAEVLCNLKTDIDNLIEYSHNYNTDLSESINPNNWSGSNRDIFAIDLDQIKKNIDTLETALNSLYEIYNQINLEFDGFDEFY